MKMLFWFIIILLIAILTCQGQGYTEIANAFAQVESSGRPFVKGDYCKKTKQYRAFGLYQFHEARWLECGGQPHEFWQVGSRRQTEIFFNELEKCRKIYVRQELYSKGIDFITAFANYHNKGHISGEQTAYVKKIKKALADY